MITNYQTNGSFLIKNVFSNNEIDYLLELLNNIDKKNPNIYF